MIDVRAARADPDSWRAALARKGAAEIFDEFLQADEAWRAANTRVDELRAARKPSGKGKPSPDEIERLNALKEELKAAEAALEEEVAKRDELLARIPNPPDPTAPDGFTEEDAVEVRRSGDPAALGFQPRDHLELGEIDMERGAKVSGSRFAYRLGDMALAELALYRFALDRLAKRGFTPVLPPVLVREITLASTPTE